MMTIKSTEVKHLTKNIHQIRHDTISEQDNNILPMLSEEEIEWMKRNDQEHKNWAHLENGAPYSSKEYEEVDYQEELYFKEGKIYLNIADITLEYLPENIMQSCDELIHHNSFEGIKICEDEALLCKEPLPYLNRDGNSLV